MAKYDWKQLEKEYILSDFKSVSSFLKDKGIKQNGSTKSRTKGWKNKKVLKEDKKSTKIVEKVIEKESEKNATARGNRERKEINNIRKALDKAGIKYPTGSGLENLRYRYNSAKKLGKIK